MKHSDLFINEMSVYQKFLIRFLQNVTSSKQASQEIPHVIDRISTILQDMFVERGFAEHKLLNPFSQRETLGASATRQPTSISISLACRPLFS
jgi:hypothetical protein